MRLARFFFGAYASSALATAVGNVCFSSPARGRLELRRGARVLTRDRGL